MTKNKPGKGREKECWQERVNEYAWEDDIWERSEEGRKAWKAWEWPTQEEQV